MRSRQPKSAPIKKKVKEVLPRTALLIPFTSGTETILKVDPSDSQVKIYNLEII